MSGCPSGVRGGFQVWPAAETGVSETTAATVANAAIETKNPGFMETPLAIKKNGRAATHTVSLLDLRVNVPGRPFGEHIEGKTS
jgi:hypothetical protein